MIVCGMFSGNVMVVMLTWCKLRECVGDCLWNVQWQCDGRDAYLVQIEGMCGGLSVECSGTT